MEGNWWDARKMFDLYLLDYMRKRNMHEAAAQFMAESGLTSAKVMVDTPDGFLHEWWTLLSDGLLSRERVRNTGEVPPEPITNEEIRQLVSQRQNMNRTQAPPLVMNNQQRPPVGRPPIRSFPVRSQPNFNDHQLNSMPPFGHMGSNPPPQMIDPCQQIPPTALASPGLANLRYLQQQEFLRQSQHPLPRMNGQGIANGNNGNKQQQEFISQIQHPSMRRNGQGIANGNNGNMQQQEFLSQMQHPSSRMNGQGIANGNMTDEAIYAAFLGSGHEIVPSDAGRSRENKPMQPEGWQTNIPLNAQNYQPAYQAMGQVQPNLMVQGSSTLTSSASPEKPVYPLIKDLRNLEVEEMVMELTEQSDNKQGQHDKNLQQSQQLEDLGKAQVGIPEDNLGKARVEVPEDEDICSFLQMDVDDFDLDSELIAFIDPDHHDTAISKSDEGFSLEEVGSLSSSKSKMLCCHFSSNGKLLASSGHEKKVWVWNTETFSYYKTAGGHSQLVTDIRFRPSSTVLATSSFDKTVQLWDASKSTRALYKLEGHSDQILSLDFHPRKQDLLCSCDRNDELRLWNVNEGRLLWVSKGATEQVRYQPPSGKLLALATGNTVRILDTDTNTVQFEFKEHVKDVRSISWDPTGQYIASVSEDSARVWSIVAGGKCAQKLLSHGRNFQSCTFHPRYPQVLMVGGYQYIEFWCTGEPSEKKSIRAHNGIIAAMSGSQEAGLFATTSHDESVKLWR